MKLLIPVAAGLEQITKRQLFSLGFDRAPADNGRIEIDGDWQDIARLNVCLRTGERVLIQLARFQATTFDKLYEGVYNIPWENWLDVDSKILMDGKSVQSVLAAIKASGGVAVDTLVAGIEEGQRSFKIVRAKPDGKSYAQDIAQKYGLSYDSIKKKTNKN